MLKLHVVGIPQITKGTVVGNKKLAWEMHGNFILRLFFFCNNNRLTDMCTGISLEMRNDLFSQLLMLVIHLYGQTCKTTKFFFASTHRPQPKVILSTFLHHSWHSNGTMTVRGMTIMFTMTRSFWRTNKLKLNNFFWHCNIIHIIFYLSLTIMTTPCRSLWAWNVLRSHVMNSVPA